MKGSLENKIRTVLEKSAERINIHRSSDDISKLNEKIAKVEEELKMLGDFPDQKHQFLKIMEAILSTKVDLFHK